MTGLIIKILAEGARKKEYKIDDIGTAAEVVRDAVTVYVHPAPVEAAAKVWESGNPASFAGFPSGEENLLSVFLGENIHPGDASRV